MNKVKYYRNILEIGNKKIIFHDNIFQVKETDDKVFILLKIPPNSTLSYNDLHNIYCYSKNGELLWQIGVRPTGDDSVYTMIRCDEFSLYANDFLGRRFKVNINTGRIEQMSIAR